MDTEMNEENNQPEKLYDILNQKAQSKDEVSKDKVVMQPPANKFGSA